MRDQQAKNLFVKSIDILNQTSPREFRLHLLTEYEKVFGITHSAACSLYNKIKKQAVQDGIIPEIGRPSNNGDKSERTLHSNDDINPSFNAFLSSLEMRIEEKNSWAIYDESGAIVSYADSGEQAARVAHGKRYERLEVL